MDRDHDLTIAADTMQFRGVGVDLDYESVGSNGSMLMVSANGTAVKLSHQL